MVTHLSSRHQIREIGEVATIFSIAGSTCTYMYMLLPFLAGVVVCHVSSAGSNPMSKQPKEWVANRQTSKRVCTIDSSPCWF
jgi:hypothetical protein